MADDDRGADHGPARQPPGRADRRPPAGRRPAGSVPRGQRPGPGAVHHHRGHRGQRHPGRQGGPPGRLGISLQCPGGRPGRPAAAVLRPGLKSAADGRGARADARPAAGPAGQDPRRRRRDRGSLGWRVDPAQGAARRKRCRVPLGVSGDRPRSRRRGAVLGTGPRSRPRPLPRRRGGRVVPQVPGRCPARQEPRKDHLAGRGRPRPRTRRPGPGQHRHRDGRIAVSGRAGQNRAGERERLPQPRHAD